MHKKKMFACFNLWNLVFEALHKQNELMWTVGVEAEKTNIKEKIWRGDLQPR